MTIRPNLGMEVCESLGLDPSVVTELDISICPPGEIAIVRVAMFCPDDLFRKETTRHYRLVQPNDWSPPTTPRFP